MIPPLPKQRTSYDTPMRALLDLGHQREREPGVVSVRAAAVFPHADVPEVGRSALAHARGSDVKDWRNLAAYSTWPERDGVPGTEHV